MPSRRELRLLSAIFVVAALLFSTVPAIDLGVTRTFYLPGSGFPADKTTLVQAIYWFVWGGSRLAIATVLLLWLASLFTKNSWLRLRRRWFGFLLLAILIGPGLIVDSGLKNHWGRARPEQIQEFGGSRHFTAPLLPANECDRNCSFVSGHVSGAAALMSFGWLAAPRRRRNWLIGSAIVSGIVGFVRIAQGGHFVSDVLFAYYAVWLGNWIAAWLLGRFSLLPRTEEIPDSLR